MHGSPPPPPSSTTNMPPGGTAAAPQLLPEDAWDIAAFIEAQPRPPAPEAGAKVKTRPARSSGNAARSAVERLRRRVVELGRDPGAGAAEGAPVLDHQPHQPGPMPRRCSRAATPISAMKSSGGLSGRR